MEFLFTTLLIAAVCIALLLFILYNSYRSNKWIGSGVVLERVYIPESLIPVTTAVDVQKGIYSTSFIPSSERYMLVLRDDQDVERSFDVSKEDYDSVEVGDHYTKSV